MSEELLELETSRREDSDSIGAESGYPKLYVTAFFGGQKDGRCIQLTIDNEYVQLTNVEVKTLIATLTKWASK